MPDFGNPFSGMKSDRKLSTEEMLRALRFNVAAEFEAVQLYKQLAESIKDPLVKKVLDDISDEELVHAGEFMSLMKKINPDEERLYAEGEKEVTDMSGTKKVSWTDYKKSTGILGELDRIASSLENTDPRISLAIDRVSDRIDHGPHRE